MTRCVKDLRIITKYWSGSEVLLDALCECLRARSPTLKHLELRIEQQFISHHPFGEALSSLQELQKLDINGSLSDFSAISDLPLLECLRLKSDWMITEGAMGSFAAHLDDVTKFPALKYISQWDILSGKSTISSCKISVWGGALIWK